MELNVLVNFLNALFNIKDIDDIAVNGLQIEGDSKVNKIGLALDYSLEVIDIAVS